MRHYSLTCFVVLPLIGFARLASGETADAADTVVVTATRVPTPEVQIASSITVLTAEDIATRQVRTLPELLQETPGLNVVQVGGPGGQASVFMRGTNSNHTKVLLDGIDVSDPSNPTGAFDFGQFLTQDIERVEILRGPQSGLYGSDAIGGVINIITRSGSGVPQAHASVEAGSFDTFNQGAGLNGSLGAWHYAADLEHVHVGETAVTPLELLPPGQRRIADYDDNLTASTKLGWDLSDRVDAGLVARYTDTHLRITGDNFANYPATPDTAQSDNNNLQYYTRATLHARSADDIFEQTLGAAYSKLRSSDLSPEESRSDYFGERDKFDWQGDVRLSSADKLIVGAEHQRDEISAPLAASTRTDSGYAEWQGSLDGALFGSASARYDDNDRFGGQFTYRIAPEYLLGGSGLRLKASLGTGFKAPTLSQLYENYPDFGFYANPQLRPERSLGWDIGFEQRLQAALQFGATYYHNRIKDLIADNADYSTYINVGKAVTQGAEAFVAFRPVTALQWRLDYTYTEATDEILHQELLRRPKHKLVANSLWQATARWSLDATLLTVSSWVDGNRDFSVPRLRAAGYTTADLASNYALATHLSVFLRVTNLFDRHYQNPVGFLQPSIGAVAGIRARF